MIILPRWCWDRQKDQTKRATQRFHLLKEIFTKSLSKLFIEVRNTWSELPMQLGVGVKFRQNKTAADTNIHRFNQSILHADAPSNNPSIANITMSCGAQMVRPIWKSVQYRSSLFMHVESSKCPPISIQNQLFKLFSEIFFYTSLPCPVKCKIKHF